MNGYDKAVLRAFLEQQLKLVPESVAETEEEAAWFLEDCLAVVVDSEREVRAYFEEAGADFDPAEIMDAAEVFPVGDGRYLIVEA